MLGASRKACTGALDGSPPDDRLPGSLAFVSMAQRCGVEWVRVHDVDETVVHSSRSATLGLGATLNCSGLDALWGFENVEVSLWPNYNWLYAGRQD